MRQLRFVSLLFFITLSLTTLGGSQTVTLKIIETTDGHGAIFPYDFINDRGTTGSLAQVQTYVQQERQNPDQQVLLLSGGDILQGQPAVYYFNFEKTNVPHLYARVMNYMGYDAGAVGNHDIETGHAVYDKFALQLDLPWLAANAVRTDNGEPYFPPYTVFERKGVKIAILGMITPGIPNWLPPGIWSGMKFDDMIENELSFFQNTELDRQPQALDPIIHSALDMTRHLIDENQIRVKLNLPAKTLALPLDADKMRIVFANLVKNACQAMPQGGTLEITAKLASSKGIIIHVQDTGVGIPTHEQDGIFEPFHTTKPRGLGLGLVNVKNIVERHDGTVYVKSKVGVGTTFFIELPYQYEV